MSKKRINETASGGATSAGGVASVPGTLNFSMQRRLPPTTLFGVAKNIRKPKGKDKE